MKYFKKIAFGMSLLLILASSAVYLIPFDAYVPEVERVLSGQLHEPVSVRHLRMAVLPRLQVELQEVNFGGSDGIAVRRIIVRPDLHALLAGEVVFRQILLEDGTAHLAFLQKLPELIKSSTTSSIVTLRQLQLSGMKLVAYGVNLGPIEAKVDFAKNGSLERVWLAMAEQKMTVIVSPQAEQHFALVMQARDWLLPQLPGLTKDSEFRLDELHMQGLFGLKECVVDDFSVSVRGMHLAGKARIDYSNGWQVQATVNQMDVQLEPFMQMLGKPMVLAGEISAKGELSSHGESMQALKDDIRFAGNVLIRNASAHISAGWKHPLKADLIKSIITLEPNRIKLDGLEARLYGGMLTGVVDINHQELSASLNAKNIALHSLVETLTEDLFFTGSMDAVTQFKMRLDKFEQFPASLQLKGELHLRNGLLTKVDLLQAAKGKTATGGTTQFDDLTAMLAVDASGYHFRKLKIASGSLKAEGKVDVNPAFKLSGALDAEVKGTAGLISMPMIVFGSVQQPVVRPSDSAMAGAAVGTLLLGPGIGTAAGIKIGGFLNKMFGKDENKHTSTDGAVKSSVRN